MKFSNKFKYTILLTSCFFIFLYGFITINMLCTQKFNLGENENNNIIIDDTKKSIIKIKEDKALLKISKNEEDGFKLSLKDYDIVFSRKALSDLKDFIIKKGENLIDFSKNDD